MFDSVIFQHHMRESYFGNALTAALVCFQLQPGDNRFVHFPILPRVLGKVSVTVAAATAGDSLAVTKSVTIRVS